MDPGYSFGQAVDPLSGYADYFPELPSNEDHEDPSKMYNYPDADTKYHKQQDLKHKLCDKSDFIHDKCHKPKKQKTVVGGFKFGSHLGTAM